MLSIDEIKALSDLNLEFEPLFKAGAANMQGWTHDTNIPAVRAMIEKVGETVPRVNPATLSYTEKDIRIPVRDGRTVAARIYTPRDVPVDGCPGFIVFHGGGYAVGNLDTEQWLCALFTELGGVAINIDYRHAPEHPFPAAIHDALDATTWTAQNAMSLGINPNKGLIIGGESSGADMALAASLVYRDEKLSPPLTGVYASMPAGATLETIPDKYKQYFLSMEQNAHAAFLTAETIAVIRKNYQADVTSPLVIPMAAPSHSNLPKTYFQICGFDPVRDCGLLLDLVYQDAGVQTRKDIYPGLPHGFWAFLPDLNASKEHREDSKKGLKWLLEM